MISREDMKMSFSVADLSNPDQAWYSASLSQVLVDFPTRDKVGYPASVPESYLHERGALTPEIERLIEEREGLLTPEQSRDRTMALSHLRPNFLGSKSLDLDMVAGFSPGALLGRNMRVVRGDGKQMSIPLKDLVPGAAFRGRHLSSGEKVAVDKFIRAKADEAIPPLSTRQRLVLGIPPAATASASFAADYTRPVRVFPGVNSNGDQDLIVEFESEIAGGVEVFISGEDLRKHHRPGMPVDVWNDLDRLLKKEAKAIAAEGENAQITVTKEDVFTLISAEILAADDPHVVAGGWLAEVTNLVSETLRVVDDRQ